MTNTPIAVDQELYNGILNADLTIQKAYELKAAIEDLKNQAAEQLKEAQKKRRIHQKNRITYSLAFTIPVFIGIVFIQSLLEFDFLEIAIEWGVKKVGFLAPLLLIAVVVLLLFYLTKFIPCKDKENLEQAAMYEAMANDKEHELAVFIETNKHHVAIIAPEFRYPVASKELMRIFRLGRAATLPEAYDKLELKLHQMKVEEGLDRIIALQIAQIGALQEVEYNTRWL